MDVIIPPIIKRVCIIKANFLNPCKSEKDRNSAMVINIRAILIKISSFVTVNN